MDKDVIYSEIEKRRKYYDGLKHSVELRKEEREMAQLVNKLLCAIESSSMKILDEERVYSTKMKNKRINIHFPLFIPDDKAFLHSLYLYVIVEKPIERFLDYILKNRDTKDSSFTELQNILSSACLDKEYDNLLSCADKNFKETVWLLEEIRLENEEENEKKHIRAWAQDKLAAEYDIKNNIPTRLLSTLDATIEIISLLKNEEAILGLKNTLMPYELDILKEIIDNEEVNRRIDFFISRKKGQTIKESCQETNKLKVNESGLEKNDGKYFSLPDDFYDLKIDFKHSSEYFNGPKFVLSADTIDSFTNLINYIADNNYIDNSIEIKRTLVYRLTGRWRPEGELKTIYWNDHRKYPLSLVYLVCYGFDPTEDKYDRMMEFFEVSQWLDRSEFSHRAIGAPKNFRMKLHELFPDVFKINENEESLQKKPKFL